MEPVVSLETHRKEVLQPPPCVRGMTTLDRDAFKVTAAVPYVEVPASSIGNLMKSVRDCLLKVRDVKPVADSSGSGGCRLLLLDPRKYSSASELDDGAKKALSSAGVDVTSHCGTTSVQLSYDSWSAEEVLRAVLPAGAAVPSSFSIIGHIAHINLKEQLQPYKHLIGQVLLDKNKCLKTVVNKVDTIDNTFRNFAMEVLAGEPNTDVTVKENGCMYQFDFAKVYWNPRLSTEHERIVAAVGPQDVVYDVFAGVGPFSIPAAKKRSTVLANDLNGESYKYLCSNFALNKVKGNYSTFNLDGRVFIRTVVRTDLVQRLASVAAEPEEGAATSFPQVHIVMNLPALAADFLDSFPGLLSDLCTCNQCRPPASYDSLMPSTVTAGTCAGGGAGVPGGGGSYHSQIAADISGEGEAATAEPASDTAAEPRSSPGAMPGACDSLTATQQQQRELGAVRSNGSGCIALQHSCSSTAHLLRCSKEPLVHCYSFGKGDNEALVRAQVAERMNAALCRQVVLPDQVRHVRNVAPNKDMFCAAFTLPADLLLCPTGHVIGQSSAAGVEPSAAAALPSGDMSTVALPPGSASIAAVTAAAPAGWSPWSAAGCTYAAALGQEAAGALAVLATEGGDSNERVSMGALAADVAAGNDVLVPQLRTLGAPHVYTSTSSPSSLTSATDKELAAGVPHEPIIAGINDGSCLLHQTSVCIEADHSDPIPKKAKVCD